MCNFWTTYNWPQARNFWLGEVFWASPLVHTFEILLGLGPMVWHIWTESEDEPVRAHEFRAAVWTSVDLSGPQGVATTVGSSSPTRMPAFLRHAYMAYTYSLIIIDNHYSIPLYYSHIIQDTHSNVNLFSHIPHSKNGGFPKTPRCAFCCWQNPCQCP